MGNESIEEPKRWGTAPDDPDERSPYRRDDIDTRSITMTKSEHNPALAALAANMRALARGRGRGPTRREPAAPHVSPFEDLR